MSKSDNFVYEELTPGLQELLDLVGDETFIKIIKTYGGISLYIPKIENLDRTMRNVKIREDFDGYNYKQLARKYNISEVWVRKIVGSSKAKNE